MVENLTFSFWNKQYDFSWLLSC